MKKKKKIIIATAVVLVIAAVVVSFLLLGKKKEFKVYTSVDELAGKKVSMLSGSVFDTVLDKYVDDVEYMYCESQTDATVMVDRGKADAGVTDEPVIRAMMNEYPNIRILDQITENEYAFIFNKESKDAQYLCKQLNEYLAKIKADGTLAEIDSVWFGKDESVKTVDFPSEGPNGTLTLGVCSATGVPFCYVKDGAYVGYDMDVAARFCKAYGYGLKIIDYNFPALLVAVQTGKDVDFGVSCITVTEERKEKILFSDANYTGGVVLFVTDEDPAGKTQTFAEFIEEQKDNFYGTFIKENRWELFVQGVTNTLVITVLSVLAGTIIGFLLFWLSYESGKIINGFITAFSYLIKGMPVVVLLMILYYVIFQKSDLSNLVVAVIGFSLVFGSAVLDLLKMSTNTVSHAQTEASLALGFSSTKTLFKVILPQALRHFLPGFQSEVVSLIKATAVVGYIAVQDLTKMSDIVRGRTYEAFFPLIVTTVIYFAVELIFIAIVKSIRVGTDPKKRPVDTILEGVKRK